MSRLRLAAVTVASACALTLAGGAGAASAGTSPQGFKHKVNITGTHGFKGTYTIQRFVKRNGRAYALGTVRGTLHGQRVVKRDVLSRVKSFKAGGTATTAQAPTPTPGACQILTLTLGPLDLNLLGLHVVTNQINLLVEAIPGPGNLLGNLLCGITNILNPPGGLGGLLSGLTGQIRALVAVLNSLLALAG